MSKEVSSQVEHQYPAIDSLEKYSQLIRQQPPAAEVQINKQAGGAKYLAIGFIEQKLDELYLGIWKTENTTMMVVANELVVSLDLSVFHPVARQWITRTGVGAVPIQQSSGSQITDMNAKIKNALQKNAPSAKALAFKNAAKGLGKVFGRDLNRADIEDFVPISTQIISQERKNGNVLKAIAKAEDSDLGSYFEAYKDVPGVPQAILERRKELKPAQ